MLPAAGGHRPVPARTDATPAPVLDGGIAGARRVTIPRNRSGDSSPPTRFPESNIMPSSARPRQPCLGHILPVAVLAIALGLASPPARAEVVPSLALGVSSGTLRFYPWEQSSGSLLLTVTNQDLVSSASLFSVNAGLILVPKNVSSGSLVVNIGEPPSDPLFTDGAGYAQMFGVTGLAPVTINGTQYSTYEWISAQNTSMSDSLAPNTTGNVAELAFFVGVEGAATVGEWELWAVNQADPAPTFWTSSSGAMPTAFSNVAASDGTAVRLATILVPEPSTWAMAAVGAAMTAGGVLRRRATRLPRPVPPRTACTRR